MWVDAILLQLQCEIEDLKQENTKLRLKNEADERSYMNLLNDYNDLKEDYARLEDRTKGAICSIQRILSDIID